MLQSKFTKTIKITLATQQLHKKIIKKLCYKVHNACGKSMK